MREIKFRAWDEETKEIALLFLGYIGFFVLMFVLIGYFNKKQEEACRQDCKPLKVQDIEIGGDRYGSNFYYELEDGRFLYSRDKSIKIGEEVCECSGRVIKLSSKDNGQGV